MSTPAAAPSRGDQAADVLTGPEPAAPRVRAVEALAGFRLRVTFAGGDVRRFDVEPLLRVGGFRRLTSEDAFARVEVDEVGGGVVWEGGANLSGDTLYYGGEPG